MNQEEDGRRMDIFQGTVYHKGIYTDKEEFQMEKVCQFLKDAGTYYLATVEGDQPRVRPSGYTAYPQKYAPYQTV